MQRLLLATLLTVPLVSPAVADEDLQNLRVLYAGDLENERTEDFRSFLEENFVDVGVVSYEALTPATADDYDVVIFDWGRVYFPEERALHMPQVPDLDDFNRPMVLIGAPGIRIAESRNAKLDWL